MSRCGVEGVGAVRLADGAYVARGHMGGAAPSSILPRGAGGGGHTGRRSDGGQAGETERLGAWAMFVD